MRLDASQHLRLEQRMKLSPRIIQAMEILQLASLALQERIDNEMQSNPVLELTEPGVDAQAPAAPEDTEQPTEQPMVVRENGNHQEDFQRLADFEREFEPWEPTSGAAPRYHDGGQRDSKMDAMANAPAPDAPLDEYLTRQWAFVDAPQNVKRAGQIIINRVEEDGYLRASLEELAKDANPQIAPATMAEALRLVQGLDPIGVAARDLRECMLLQLAAEQAAGRDMSLEHLLVERYLRDVELNRLPAIAARTHKTVEQVKAALQNLSHLNPRPGLLVGQRPAPVIAPDVMVDIGDDGQVRVWLPESNTPSLYISKSYQKLARDRKTAADARQFLQKNIRSAQWLIGAIKQRRETVRRVACEVFAFQREFVFHGPEAMKPLPMANVAAKVGIHVATVSRAVAGKYAQTPWGIFPLRSFFSGGTTTAGGEHVSWDVVKLKLKELIGAEDKQHPLDDETLAAEMQKHGIKIARRTVAKYRELLEIPPARRRRQF